MTARRTRHVTLTAAGALGLAAALAGPAQAAVPKVTDYKLTGQWTLWAEPKAPEGSDPRWPGCFVEQPSLSFTSITGGPRVRIAFTATATGPGGWPIGFGNPFAGILQWGIARNEGPAGEAGWRVFNIDYSHGFVPSFPGSVPARGRATLYSTLTYTQRWGGVDWPAQKPLPTRSVPLIKVNKPAGTCAVTPNAISLALY